MKISFALRLTMTLVMLILIVIVSVVPGQAQPGDSIFVWLASATPTPLQKSLHVIAYAVLAFLCMWTLDDIESRPIRITAALAITITTGALLEWYQIFVPGRFGTVTDAILNAVGAILGVLGAAILL